MTATMTDEYRQLGYDTSNDMIRHDARRGDRKYAAAALHIRNAGFGRLRMGQIMFDTGDFAQAAADWLSAAACFYQVPDLKQMQEATARVWKLDQEGKIPPERRDIHAVLKEREEQIKALEQKLAQFEHDSNSSQPLEWLLRQVRELPGLANLHTSIVGLAIRLGQFPLAAEHLDWAEKFEPANPQLAIHRSTLKSVPLDGASGIPIQPATPGNTVL